MFLPDRYVEGTCPVCSNPEARGDQCERCGTFLSPTELINPISKISGETPVVRETTHLYFPLGDFQERLQAYIRERDTRDGWKPNVLAYCNSWFKDGLTDRAYTRDLNWGVKVPLPGYEDKVLYVWFDAVLGYISGTKVWANNEHRPDAWKDYWLHDDTKYVAFVGKDNIVFHCIVLPAFLMAWNDHNTDKYVLPENVPANEFLNFESKKFSKSKGWGIDLDEFLDKYPADLLRYTLAVNLPEARDADFTWKDFQAHVNNELADIFGNFVNRTLTFAHKNFGGRVPEEGKLNVRDEEILKRLETARDSIGAAIDHYKFRDSTYELIDLARAANKYFNDSEPWKSLKSDPAACGTCINVCLQIARSLAILAEPFVPGGAAKLWRLLGCTGLPSEAGWESVGAVKLPAGHALNTPEILFTKIEDDVIERELNSLPAEAPAVIPEAEKKTPISIDEFRKIDLRVGKIVAAEAIPKSKKLLKLQVEIGTEQRQILAGIAQRHTPESLIGKKVIVVANLEPAKLMGHESQGMILAATDANDAFSLLGVGDDILPGAGIK
jgi:methionyl-tRNA synthetase